MERGTRGAACAFVQERKRRRARHSYSRSETSSHGDRRRCDARHSPRAAGLMLEDALRAAILSGGWRLTSGGEPAGFRHVSVAGSHDVPAHGRSSMRMTQAATTTQMRREPPPEDHLSAGGLGLVPGSAAKTSDQDATDSATSLSVAVLSFNGAFLASSRAEPARAAISGVSPTSNVPAAVERVAATTAVTTLGSAPTTTTRAVASSVLRPVPATTIAATAPASPVAVSAGRLAGKDFLAWIRRVGRRVPSGERTRMTS